MTSKKKYGILNHNYIFFRGEEQPPRYWEEKSMSLTRRMLREMSLADDQIEAIIEAHTEVVNGLKDERDKLKDNIASLKESANSAQEEKNKLNEEIEKLHTENDKLRGESENLKADAEKQKANAEKLKAEADKLPAVEEEIKSLKEQLSESEKKHSDLEKEIEDYKTQQSEAATLAAKENAYKEMLKEAGVSKKRIDSVLRVTNFDNVELDEDGKLKDRDKIVESVKSEWSDFIETKRTDGADVKKPPVDGSGGKLTKEEILKIKDTSERQQKIAENHELFGF